MLCMLKLNPDYPSAFEIYPSSAMPEKCEREDHLTLLCEPTLASRKMQSDGSNMLSDWVIKIILETLLSTMPDF